MKTYPALLLIGLAAISIASQRAFSAPASATVPAKAYTVTVVERYNTTLIERGMPEFTVRRQLGEASRKLDRHHWIYERFEALPSRGATDDCSTLLIVFSEGKVADLKLLNKPAEKVIAANLNNKSIAPKVATTQ